MMSLAGRLWRLDHAHAEKGLDASASWTIQPSSLPQLSGDHDGIDAACLPPCDLVAASMQGAMVGPAQGDCIFVADSAAECTRLGETQVMGIRGPSPADQAWLRRHEPKVGTIAVATRFAERECAFVDVPCHGIVGLPRRAELLRQDFGVDGNQRCWSRRYALGCDRLYIRSTTAIDM
jgi:hypothetical protein